MDKNQLQTLPGSVMFAISSLYPGESIRTLNWANRFSGQLLRMGGRALIVGMQVGGAGAGFCLLFIFRATPWRYEGLAPREKPMVP